MKKYTDSYVTLNWLSWECNNHLSKLEILDALHSLSPELQNTELAKNITHFTTLPDVPQIGERYIDFIQYTEEGDTISLSDFDGKITLVSYWSSTCYGSTFENPIIVKEYEKYHKDGFEILGVSSETNKKDFIKGLKNSNLTWLNVTDFKGSFNEVAMLYNFKMTPYNILINKEGIITHRNLRGDKLKKVLAAIFNEEVD